MTRQPCSVNLIKIKLISNQLQNPLTNAVSEAQYLTYSEHVTQTQRKRIGSISIAHTVTSTASIGPRVQRSMSPCTATIREERPDRNQYDVHHRMHPPLPPHRLRFALVGKCIFANTAAFLPST